MDMKDPQGRFERVCTWLRSNYSAQQDCEILQAEIWDNFATFSLRECLELSLSPTEFFACVAKTFPGAISTAADGAMGVYIIRGIAKPSQPEWAPCTNSYCGCPNHRVPPVLHEEEDKFGKDPRFVQLTRSNDCPTSVQADCITALVTDLEDRMSSLDRKLVPRHNLHDSLRDQATELSFTLRTLRQTKMALQSAIKKWKTVLDRARRCLPVELWSHIFLEAIEPPRATNGLPQHMDSDSAKYDGPWTLQLVCKQWRAIVLGTPEIWSLVDVDLCQYCDSSDHSGFLRRLGLQLIRSQSSKITAVLYSRDRSHFEPHFPPSLTAIFLPFAPRIQELVLSVPLGMIEDLSVWSSSLQGLRTLVIRRPRASYGLIERLTTFSACRSLRNLTLCDINCPEMLGIPLSQLTRLTILPEVGSRPRVLRPMMEEATNLDHLSAFIVGRSRSPYQPTPLTCHRLSILSISYSYSRPSVSLSQLLSELTLPALVDLEMYPRKSGGPIVHDWTIVEKCLKRSRCPLRRLLLGPVRLVQLADLLPLAPSLNNLTLTVIKVDEEEEEEVTELDELLRVLHVSAPQLCPELDNVTLKGIWKLDGRSLIDMAADARADGATWAVDRVKDTTGELRPNPLRLEVAVVDHRLPENKQTLVVGLDRNIPWPDGEEESA